MYQYINNLQLANVLDELVTATENFQLNHYNARYEIMMS